MSNLIAVHPKRPRLSRSFLPIAGLLISAPLTTIFPVVAFAMQDAGEDTDQGPQSGTLLFANKDGSTQIAAVQLGTDMNVSVSGNIARVRVTQAFRNTSSEWMAATYLYPMPEDAAVDSLKMTVGQRVIIGHIKKREEAREIYETAKQEGKKAGLVEQQRPNMFTSEVANVGPGETVLIVVEYQMPLRQLDGTFSLRLPLVVGPRYVSPQSLTSSAKEKEADTITAAPIIDPKRAAKINPVSITVQLNPGFVPANIDSPYHKIAVDGKGAVRTIRLAAGTVPADKDFELKWRSASADPVLSLYKEQVGDKHYVMASITPPVADTVSFIPPREMIFVIDNSGSMGGTSMDEAKASLLHALSTLRPQDYFNVIRFDDSMTQLFTTSVPASEAKIVEAKAFTQQLEADGGTEMLPALKAALIDQGVTDRNKVVRQIIFLTDGSISNEQEMLASIGADQGRSRVFMVGIGSAPNNYLMSKMANMGRGIYTNISDVQEVTVKMTKLIDMLSKPNVQDLKVTVSGNSFSLTPTMLPDLYAGEPLLLMGQADSLAGTVTVSGRIGNRTWTQKLDLTQASVSTSVAKAWARRRIDDIEVDRTLGKIEDAAADQAIAEIGLNFSLVTSQTSLVAVDETPSRPTGTPLREEDLPVNLPDGWDFETLLGGETAAAALANEATQRVQNEMKPFKLPQTANNYALSLFGGLLALMIGLLGLVTLRSKKEV
jgi:Ca-activated chloride channel homolog